MGINYENRPKTEAIVAMATLRSETAKAVRVMLVLSAKPSFQYIAMVIPLASAEKKPDRVSRHSLTHINAQ